MGQRCTRGGVVGVKNILSSYPWPTDEEGERALQAVKDTMPSEAQTRYNQRDIKKRNEKLRATKKNIR